MASGIESRLDRLEERLDRLSDRIEEINLSEAIVKGRYILEIYDRLHALGVIDIYQVSEEIMKVKSVLRSIQYHPWEWLQRDPNAYKSFISRLEKRIAEEVRQAALFTLYEEQPNIVVKIVKDAVKEYLDIWEVNDQIAYQLVKKVINERILSEILKILSSIVMSKEYMEKMYNTAIYKRTGDLRGMMRRVKEEG